MNDIERAIEDLKDVNTILKTQHMCKVLDDELTKKDVEDYKSRFASVNLATKALEKQLNGGWIPVSDRLPSYDCMCLVTDGENVFIANYDACLGWGSYKFNKTITFRRTKYVTTAWQPLPPVWKGNI